MEMTELTEMQKMMAEKSVKLISQNNPIMAHKFGADPAVLVYKDTVYIYSTNDMQQMEYTKGNEDNRYNKITSLNLFSSKDLVNWTDLGEIPVAGKNGGKGDAKWASNSWAPAIACKEIDGKDKFFLYFADSGNGIGVLSADCPQGPFTDPIKKPLISRQTPNCANVNWLFDPAVFVDDDGKGYIYFGGGHNPDNFDHPKTARCAALGDDMISIIGTPSEIDAPYLFEDSGINKFNNTYYYSYCANWTERPKGSGPEVPPPAVIAYMTSDNPLGPFTYKGWTLKNPGNYFGAWGNNHHWIFDFKGKHYIAYHTQTMEKQMGLEHGGYRGIFINEFTVNEDGSLPVQNASMTGAEQVGRFNPYQTIPAASFHSSRYITITSKQTVIPISDSAYLCLKGVDLAEGSSKIRLKLANSSGDKNASIKLTADHFAGNGSLLADIKVGKKTELEAKVEPLSGTHDLYLLLSGAIELESWELIK